MEATETSNRDNLTTEYRIVILKNGPYLVKGNLPINRVRVTFDQTGTPAGYELVESYPPQANRILCRCGSSKQKPFCDGSHLDSVFSGVETASRKPYYQQARKLVGRNLILFDQRDLCMGIGFCHPGGSVWNLTRFSDCAENRELAIREAINCPSGRLVVADKSTGVVIEPHITPCISIIEDSRVRGDSPIWLRGGITLESQDGTLYETRYRVTLCSCGKSRNKPFCDGRHYFA